MMAMLKTIDAKRQTILLVEQLASHALAIANRTHVVEHGQIELEQAATLATPAVCEAFLGMKRKPG
jgi:ABC-type branched-subunit amino acid transport system ATPase component